MNKINNTIRLVVAVTFGGVIASSAVAQNAITGNYQLTLNAWSFGKSNPSWGHKIGLSYSPKFGGSLDLRLEYYTDGSFNADPPGVLDHAINEGKFEGQLMYSRALSGSVGVTAGLLYHNNYRFTDRYWWLIAGLTFNRDLARDWTLSAALVGEQKTNGARAFYDFSGTLEYRFSPGWNAQAALHRYENVGETDPDPTQKEELEFGINRQLNKRQTVGVSFFRHIQLGAPNDQFSFLKLKYTVRF